MIDTVKNYWDKLKSFVNSDTDLFLGIVGFVAPIGIASFSVLIYLINLLTYAYHLIYYYIGYDVPMEYFDSVSKDSMPTSILLGFALFCIIIANGFLAKLLYRNRIPRVCLVIIETLFFIFLMICPWFGHDFCKLLSTLTPFWIVLTLTITLFLTLSVFTFSLSEKDKLENKKNQKKHLSNQIEKLLECHNSIEKKRKALAMLAKQNKLTREIQNLNKAVSKQKITITNMVINIFSFTVLLLFIAFSMTFSMAMFNMLNRTELTIVTGQENICNEFSEALFGEEEQSQAEQKELYLAVIYQNDQGVLVSPCEINHNKATIYTNHQQFIDSEELMLYTHTCDSIDTADMLLRSLAETTPPTSGVE